MTVTLNNSQGNVTVTGTSINISYASGSGADRLLLLQTTNWVADYVTAATYNGSSLTLQDNNSGQKLWSLVAPSPGTNTLNLSVSTYSSVAYEASDWENVDQTTPVGTVVKASGTSSSPATASITCPSGGAIFGGEFSGYNTSGSVTAGSGTTLTHSGRNPSNGYTAAGGYRANTGTISFSTPSSAAWRAQGVPINAASGGDTTAPTLTSPTSTQTGSTTASGTVSTDEGNGTLYYLASTNATETVGTVKAASSQAVSATGSQSVSFTGLTASTTYYAHYVHTDAATNDSTVANSASFTTAAAASTYAPNINKPRPGMGTHFYGAR